MTHGDVNDLITHRKWEKAVARMKTEEGRCELSLADANGNRPLHLAFLNGAPYEVVQSIVDGYPGAVKLTNDLGRLALHLACWPEEDGYEISTRSIRLLLDVYPGGASRATDVGRRLPLHVAARYRAPLNVLRMLVDVHPGGVAAWDERGRLPIHFLARGKASPGKEEDVEKVEMLIRPLLKDYDHGGGGGEEASCLIPDPHSGETPLHMAARFDVLRLHEYVKVPRCPPDIIMRVARRHPDQLRESDDDDGNLPLHVAASNPNLNGSRDGRDDFITNLVKLCPEAASALNGDGRSPLILAIESGKIWDEGVEAIADAAEHMITVRDEATNLYPFMLSATGVSPCINTVYSLLRLCPELRRYVLK